LIFNLPISVPLGPRNNVWSSTFDPGRNSNMRKVGASYYDNPSEENKGSIWDEHLKSESSRPKSFDEAPKQPSATIASNKIESAMKQASTGSGTVDYEKFMSLLKQ
jgi:hypothetical protein